MLPKDPIMLMSCINTHLRDHYASLDELCSSVGVDKEELCGILAQAGYEYDSEINRFKVKGV